MSPRRRQRGFTLLELGIVLGMASILLTGAAVLGSGAFRAAKNQRAAEELKNVAQSAATALARGLVVTRPAWAAAPSYQFEGPNTLNSNPAVAPLCFDLSRAALDRSCASATGQGASAWPGVAAPPPINEAAGLGHVRAAFGSVMPNNGFNVFCQPYMVCFRPHSAEVRTCVPAKEANAIRVGAGASRCALSCPPDPGGERMECVTISATSLKSRTARLQLSYSDELMAKTPRSFFPAPPPP